MSSLCLVMCQRCMGICTYPCNGGAHAEFAARSRLDDGAHGTPWANRTALVSEPAGPGRGSSKSEAVPASFTTRLAGKRGALGWLLSAVVSERAGVSLPPCADDHGIERSEALMIAPCGVQVRPPRMIKPRNNRVSRRRRPLRILFLLGSKLAKLWAFRLLIRATAKGVMHWRMAPFIDDDRQITQLTTTGPTNPGHADTKTTHFPSQMGSPMAEAEAVDCAEDISVALEWKLLFPLLTPGAEDPRPDDGRPILEASCDDERACLEQAHECVARAIREVGEEAVTMHALLMKGVEEKEFWGSSWVVKKANSAVPMGEEESLKGYTWVPVEICSPKMRFKDPRTRLRMQRVLDALNSKHRLSANCSCEVHIHLGRMDGRAWTLSTLKRLGSLLWVAEPTLRSIRDPNSLNFDNTYTWGFAMRQRSRLAVRLQQDVNRAATVFNEPGVITDGQVITALQGLSTVPAKDANALVRVWRTASHLELGQLLSGPEKKHRRLGFNFSAFGEEDDRAKRNPRTIEFRMMDGSVETGLVLGWLAICGTVAETAVTASDPRFGAALGLLLQRSESDGRQLCEGLAAGETEMLGEQRGREFGELMQALGVEEQHYRGFEDKIRREH